MASADLRRVMLFQGRRGSAGKTWFEAERAGRRFVLFQGALGLTLFERVKAKQAERQERTKAQPTAPPRPTSRRAPKKVHRELAALGLVQAGDVVEEVAR